MRIPLITYMSREVHTLATLFRVPFESYCSVCCTFCCVFLW